MTYIFLFFVFLFFDKINSYEIPTVDFGIIDYNEIEIINNDSSFYYINNHSSEPEKKTDKNEETSNEVKTIKFNTTNTLTLKGVINAENTNRFLHQFNLKENKNQLYLFIDSPGGSVEDGYKIIAEIMKYNITCIAEKAYSMAFAILQSCTTRYILPFGKLMQHQISLGLMNELGKIESYIKFINEMEVELLKLQSNKIGISSEELKNRTMNEWWLFSNNAINENCADNIVNVECTKKLTLDTYTINSGMYDYIYSKCPLIPDYIEKKENNKNNKDYIYFI
jgi:ATP-dependent Clp protease, protease subunit|tara:strand:+ start:3867 stop:4709 length:843 start_codon:yes stop_codon:yes gene_type:complete